MKALLLNGEKNAENSLENFSNLIREGLKNRNYAVETMVLHEKKIADCIGCFGCWVKTPGICVIDDYAQEVAKVFINSDLVVYLTPVVFGGYSYQLKKALDRMIPLISPFFIEINGEIHHKPRYEKYPSILGIGVMPELKEEQTKLFNNLIKRNSINLHSPTNENKVFKSDEDISSIQQSINDLLKKIGDKNE